MDLSVYSHIDYHKNNREWLEVSVICLHCQAAELYLLGGYTNTLHWEVGTMKWFREELYTPSEVIDRDTLEAWENKGSKSTWDRAQDRVESLLSQYQPSPISDAVKKELRDITTKEANKAGMKKLPDISFE